LKRRAFTLIELLVVIALVTLLGLLTVMAIGHMQTNGKRQQTRLMLQNLQAMFADYDVNRRVPFGAGDLNPNQFTTNIINAISLNAPGDVASGNDRFGLVNGSSVAVPVTRAFMTQMIAIPSNATAMGKLPPSSLMTFAGSSAFASNTWGTNSQYGIYYPVTYTDANSNTAIYIRTLIITDGVGNVAPDTQTQAPPNYYYWMSAQQIPIQGTPLTTPVPLDAWGNPIIFVLGGVLSQVNAGGQTVNVHAPDYHPFFASAGPDGNFSKGDDNMYSFEK
jgi:prepilin-type N-terminal cleavage/methylation domain-containing protein